MRKILLSLLVVCLIVIGMYQWSTAADKNPEKGFMRAKLMHSQKILEDLALEDFTSMAKNAEQLRLLSLDANWQVLQTEEYAMHSHHFRQSAAGLIAASEKKNLDGAVLAYFQMTQSCVNCHRHVRDQR
jgi:hypothetical protein